MSGCLILKQLLLESWCMNTTRSLLNGCSPSFASITAPTIIVLLMIQQDGASSVSPNPLLSPCISSGSVVCLQALVVFIIHTVSSSAWHLTPLGCVSPIARRTLACHCWAPATGSLVSLVQHGPQCNEQGGAMLTFCPLFVARCQDPPPQWLHYKPPYSHNLTEQASNIQYP